MIIIIVIILIIIDEQYYKKYKIKLNSMIGCGYCRSNSLIIILKLCLKITLSTKLLCFYHSVNAT